MKVKSDLRILLITLSRPDLAGFPSKYVKPQGVVVAICVSRPGASSGWKEGRGAEIPNPKSPKSTSQKT